MSDGIAWLRGAAVADEAAARADLAKRLEDPAKASAAFVEAFGETLKRIPGEAEKTARMLGYFERLLEPATSGGWAAVRAAILSIGPALPGDLKRALPLSVSEWQQKQIGSLLLAFSLDFRARTTAAALRGNFKAPILQSQALDVVADREEKKALVELVRREIEKPAPEVDQFLRDFEAAMTVKRVRRYSSIYQPVPTTPSAATGGVPLLLLVEPDVGVRNALKTGLSTQGFRVVEVGNGTDAEAHLFGASPPDLVVLEPRLAGVPGMTLLGRLRGRKPPLPVVLMSAQDSLASDFEVKTHPKLQFLKKPVLLSGLLKAIQAVRG